MLILFFSIFFLNLALGAIAENVRTFVEPRGHLQETRPVGALVDEAAEKRRVVQLQADLAVSKREQTRLKAALSRLERKVNKLEAVVELMQHSVRGLRQAQRLTKELRADIASAAVKQFSRSEDKFVSIQEILVELSDVLGSAELVSRVEVSYALKTMRNQLSSLIKAAKLAYSRLFADSLPEKVGAERASRAFFFCFLFFCFLVSRSEQKKKKKTQNVCSYLQSD